MITSQVHAVSGADLYFFGVIQLILNSTEMQYICSKVSSIATINSSEQAAGFMQVFVCFSAQMPSQH